MAAVNNKNNNQAQEKAEIAIAELRSRYSEKMREQYESAAAKLREERDDALRENWILQQQAQAALPEQMAAQGINGGAAETSMAKLGAQYQSERNKIRSGYADELGELGSENSEKQTEAMESYDKKWIDYLLSLAKKEADSKYGR